MEELLQQAKDLVTSLRDKLSNVTKQSEQLSTERNMVEAQKADQETYSAELAGRELECRKVEDVQSLLDNAKVVQQDIQTERAKLNGDWDKLTLEYKKIAQKNTDQALSQDLINKGNDILKKGNAELKDARENMKEKILEELKAKV